MAPRAKETIAPKQEDPFDPHVERVRNPQTFRYETPEFESGKGLVK